MGCSNVLSSVNKVGGGEFDGSGTANTLTMFTAANTLGDSPVSIGSADQALFASGTSDFPGVAFASEVGTGMYLPGAKTLEFRVDGTKLAQMFKDGGGNTQLVVSATNFMRVDCQLRIGAGDTILFGNGTAIDGDTNPTAARTINTPNASGDIVTSGSTTITDAANLAWDMSGGTDAVVTVTASRIVDNPTNIVRGKVSYTFTHSGAGYNPSSWGSAYKFAGGTAPTLGAGGASSVDCLVFHSDGTNLYHIGSTLNAS